MERVVPMTVAHAIGFCGLRVLAKNAGDKRRSSAPLFLVLIPVLAGSLLAQDAQITRDGQQWKRVLPGTFAAKEPRVLKISTRGRVVLRNSNTDLVTYKLTQHVRARTEEEAHRLFGSVVSSIGQRNGITQVTLMPTARDIVNDRVECCRLRSRL